MSTGDGRRCSWTGWTTGAGPSGAPQCEQNLRLGSFGVAHTVQMILGGASATTGCGCVPTGTMSVAASARRCASARSAAAAAAAAWAAASSGVGSFDMTVSVAGPVAGAANGDGVVVPWVVGGVAVVVGVGSVGAGFASTCANIDAAAARRSAAAFFGVRIIGVSGSAGAAAGVSADPEAAAPAAPASVAAAPAAAAATTAAEATPGEDVDSVGV